MSRFSLPAASLAALVLGCTMMPADNANMTNTNDNTADSSAVTVDLAPGFDLVDRIGTTTGTTEGFCGGFVGATPNHTMFIDGSFGMTVSAIATDAEPSLWILCGQSNFCGDVTARNTSAISRFWTSGSCDVYVGTANQDQTMAYTVQFDAN